MRTSVYRNLKKNCNGISHKLNLLETIRYCPCYCIDVNDVLLFRNECGILIIMLKILVTLFENVKISEDLDIIIITIDTY